MVEPSVTKSMSDNALEVSMTTADPFDVSSLHTAAIDARNGYTEALEDAEGKGLTAVFQDMIQLHTRLFSCTRDLR